MKYTLETVPIIGYAIREDDLVVLPITLDGGQNQDGEIQFHFTGETPTTIIPAVTPMWQAYAIGEGDGQMFYLGTSDRPMIDVPMWHDRAKQTIESVRKADEETRKKYGIHDGVIK